MRGDVSAPTTKAERYQQITPRAANSVCFYLFCVKLALQAQRVGIFVTDEYPSARRNLPQNLANLAFLCYNNLTENPEFI